MSVKGAPDWSRPVRNVHSSIAYKKQTKESAQTTSGWTPIFVYVNDSMSGEISLVHGRRRQRVQLKIRTCSCLHFTPAVSLSLCCIPNNQNLHELSILLVCVPHAKPRFPSAWPAGPIVSSGMTERQEWGYCKVASPSSAVRCLNSRSVNGWNELKTDRRWAASGSIGSVKASGGKISVVVHFRKQR